MAASNKFLRWTIAVLASAWFVPVSCTVATGIGTEIIAGLDARDAAKGDAVHRSIAVVVLPAPAPGQAFGHLLLGNVSAYKERHPDATFLMPAPEGKITVDTSIVVSYKVIDGAGTGQQTIETNYKDGDRDAWGRYRAARRDITPLASRLFEVSYTFVAIPIGLLFAFVICSGARFARRRMRQDVPA